MVEKDIYIPKTDFLRNAVSAIWQVKDHRPNQTETIIPKGVVEVIFDLSERASAVSQIGNRHFELPKFFINGFNTFPIQLHLPEQHFFFGVQFHPVAVRQLFGIPAGEFSNLPIDLLLVDPAFEFLWQQLAEANFFKERIAIISRWIENKLVQNHPQELLLNSFLRNQDGHGLTTNELANTVYYSPRHLSRKIFELTGMNTEQILRYKKYLHAVQLMHHTNHSLTQIAYDCHFSDQSHFTKSFKSFAQMTPNEYRKNKSDIPGHLEKDVR